MGPIRSYLPVHRAAAGRSERDGILLHVAEEAAAFADAEACLLLAGEDGSLSVAAAVTRCQPEALEGFRLSAGGDLAQSVRESLEVGPDAGVLSVPVAHGQVPGALVMIRRNNGDLPRGGRGIEEAVLEALAGQAAITLEYTARLEQAEAAAANAVAAELTFRSLIEAAPDPIVIVDRSARMVLVNGEAERCFGHSRGDLLGQHIHTLIPARYHEKHAEHLARYLASPQLRPMGIGLELRARRRDGSEFPVEVSLGPLETVEGVLVTVTVRDVTERKQAEHERARLLESEHRKTQQLILTVREAHHRIKNNLQAVTDLLSLELASRASGTEAEVLRGCIERVQAIALVHDLLSHDQDVEHVDAGEVIQRLVPKVLRGSGLDSCSIQVSINTVSLPVASKRATTLALVLNELVSNAAKHALACRAEGALSVSLAPEEHELVLAVADDGPGLPDGFDPDRDGNVGMQVIRTLVESDLGGTLWLRNRGGLEARVQFPS